VLLSAFRSSVTERGSQQCFGRANAKRKNGQHFLLRAGEKLGAETGLDNAARKNGQHFLLRAGEKLGAETGLDNAARKKGQHFP
jgi:hypothetical protein